MKNIYVKNALNMSAWLVFFVNLVTFNFFFYYFQYKLNGIFKEVLKEPEDKALIDKLHKLGNISLIAMGVSLGCLVLFMITGYTIFDLIRGVSSMGVLVVTIYWAFTARVALRQYALVNFGIDHSVNGFLLFFWPATALTYKINDLENEIKLHEMKANS